MMHGLYIEHRLKGSSTVADDLAKHLYTRILQGQAAIIAQNPVIMLSMVRKYWLKIERQLLRQRSSTLDPRRILEITRQISRVQTLRFTAKPPIEDPIGDVLVSTVEQFIAFAPTCQTLYVTYTITTEQLYFVTSWMPRGGLVVIYDDGMQSLISPRTLFPQAPKMEIVV